MQTEIERITIPGQGPALEALLARPAEAADRPVPGVLLVHDITGGEADIEHNLRIVAAAGYNAMAPLLFTAGPSRVRCIVTTMRSLLMRKGPAFALLERSRAALAGDASSTGDIAIVGFCMGGGFALLEADQRYVASAPFYGAVAAYDFIDENTCPIVASFGGHDPATPFGEKRLRRALNKHQVPHDTKTYPGVGHSFANQLDVPGGQKLLRILGLSYNAPATSDAWQRILAFFDEQFREAVRAHPPLDQVEPRQRNPGEEVRRGRTA